MYCLAKYIENMAFSGFDGYFGGHFENGGHFDFFNL